CEEVRKNILLSVGAASAEEQRTQWVRDAAAEIYDHIRGGKGYSNFSIEQSILLYFRAATPSAPASAKVYSHNVICNGDRRKPPGTKGISCCCFNSSDWRFGYIAGLI